MRPDQPGRWGSGGGREIDRDSVLVQEIKNSVQPVEVEKAWTGLQQGPGKYPNSDETDPGFAHQLDVLLPHLLRPLLGVVVATKGDSGDGRSELCRASGVGGHV